METVGISSVYILIKSNILILYSRLPLAATGATDNKLNIYDLNSLQLRVTCTHEVMEYCCLMLIQFRIL